MRRRAGFVLALAVALGAILMAIAFALSWGSRQQLQMAIHRLGSERAQAAADSGLVLALKLLGENSAYAGLAQPVLLGDGPETYHIQVLRSPNRTLDGQAIPSDCIYVVSTGFFAPTTRRRACALVRPGVSDGKGVPGAFGSSILLSNGASIDSYDSRLGAYKKGGSEAKVVTNSSKAGSVQITGGARIAGTILVGVDGQVDATAPNGSTMGKSSTVWKDWGTSYEKAEVQATPLDLPVVEAPGNPGSKDLSLNSRSKELEPGNYRTVTISNGARLTLQAGTYIFEKLDISGGARIDLAEDGPVQIFVSKEMQLSNGARLSENGTRPELLQIYLGNGAKYDQSGGTDLVGIVYGPGAEMELSNSATIFGALVGDKVKLSGAASIHYDLALSEFSVAGSSSGGNGSSGLTVLFRQRL